MQMIIKRAIKKLCNHIIKVKNLDINLYDLTLQRENLASTVLDNFVAMPHPIKSIMNTTFVTVALLKTDTAKNKDIKIILFF